MIILCAILLETKMLPDLTLTLQGMLHLAVFLATCVTTKLQDMLWHKLLSVTAPLHYSICFALIVLQFCCDTSCNLLQGVTCLTIV